jgi:hypothetical protein
LRLTKRYIASVRRASRVNKAIADNTKDEDPFCAFIARRAVRGRLTPDGGDKIPDYCRGAKDAARSLPVRGTFSAK